MTNDKFTLNELGTIFEGTVNEVSAYLATIAWLYGLGIDKDGYCDWVEQSNLTADDLLQIDEVNEMAIEWINQYGTTYEVDIELSGNKDKVLLVETDN
jgi:hypothetical protein